MSDEPEKLVIILARVVTGGLYSETDITSGPSCNHKAFLLLFNLKKLVKIKAHIVTGGLYSETDH